MDGFIRSGHAISILLGKHRYAGFAISFVVTVGLSKTIMGRDDPGRDLAMLCERPVYNMEDMSAIHLLAKEIILTAKGN